MKRKTLADAQFEIEQLNEQIKRLLKENTMLKAKIDEYEKAERNPRGAGRKQKITGEMLLEIEELLRFGSTQREIATQYGVGVGTINRALRSRTRFYSGQRR